MSRESIGIEIKSGEFIIKITSTAAYNTAYDIFYALRQTCATHWVNHPDAYLKSEEERLGRMKLFFEMSGYGDQYKGRYDELLAIVRKEKI